MLSEDDRREIKSALQEELIKTEASIAAFREMTAPVGPENSIGRVSRIDAIQNKSIVEAALRKAEEKMIGLINMEKKLENPDFGLCSVCKKPIPAKRLVLMPQSSKCVCCAQ